MVQNAIANRFVIKDLNKFYQALEKDSEKLKQDMDVIEQDNTQLKIDQMKNFFTRNLGYSIPITLLLALAIIAIIVYLLYLWRKRGQNYRRTANREIEMT